MGYKTTYDTYDPWQAAYLDALGIPLMDCRLDERGRATWTFANDDDAAWMAGIEYRQDTNAVVPVKAYKQSFRRVLDVANAKRAMREVNSNEQGRNEYAA